MAASEFVNTAQNDAQSSPLADVCGDESMTKSTISALIGPCGIDGLVGYSMLLSIDIVEPWYAGALKPG